MHTGSRWFLSPSQGYPVVTFPRPNSLGYSLPALWARGKPIDATDDILRQHKEPEDLTVIAPCSECGVKLVAEPDCK